MILGEDLRLEERRNSHSTKTFITFYNYLSAIDIARNAQGWTKPKTFLSELKMRNKKIQGRVLCDSQKLKFKEHLFQVWSRQASLEHLKDAPEDHVALSLQGLFNDFFYIFYHAAQAYLLASGKPEANNHSALLQVLSRDREKFPGHIASHCKMESDGNLVYSSLAGSNLSTSVSNLANPHMGNFQSHLRLLLKTTRQELLEKKLDALKRKQKTKKLDAKSKHEASLNLESITIFHFLYRLRCRFDYQDAQTMCSRPEKITAVEFYRVLRQCYVDVIISLEWLCAQYIGKCAIRNIRDSFAQKNVSNLSATVIVARLDSRIDAYFVTEAA